MFPYHAGLKAMKHFECLTSGCKKLLQLEIMLDTMDSNGDTFLQHKYIKVIEM